MLLRNLPNFINQTQEDGLVRSFIYSCRKLLKGYSIRLYRKLTTLRITAMNAEVINIICKPATLSN